MSKTPHLHPQSIPSKSSHLSDSHPIAQDKDLKAISDSVVSLITHIRMLTRYLHCCLVLRTSGCVRQPGFYSRHHTDFSHTADGLIFQTLKSHHAILELLQLLHTPLGEKFKI